MRIVFTGGGTGGHFYPIIAVAESVRHLVDQEKILNLKLYYFSDAPYDKEALFETGLEFVQISAGKRRNYGGIQNFFDLFKTGFGTIGAMFSLFSIYPDVVFCKGGYASFPVTLAARIIGIPVVVHESDSVPGRVTKWAGKFAKRVAVSYPDAAQYFPKKKVAVTGQPIREVLKEKKPEGSFEYLKLDPTVPTIFVIGGSQGAEAINNAILDALPLLLEKYQVIHQTGAKNFEEVKLRAEFLLNGSNLLNRYRPYPFLNPLAMKMAAGASSLVISRSGSSIFEFASWGLPAILIPIPERVSHDQRSNAYSYARHGGAIVIEENNISTPILLSEVERFFKDSARREKMIAAAKSFSTPDAATKIARQIVDIALEHER